LSEPQRFSYDPASGEYIAVAADPDPAAGNPLDGAGLDFGTDAHAGTGAPAPGTFSFEIAPSADSAGNLPGGLSLEPTVEPSCEPASGRTFDSRLERTAAASSEPSFRPEAAASSLGPVALEPVPPVATMPPPLPPLPSLPAGPAVPVAPVAPVEHG